MFLSALLTDIVTGLSDAIDGRGKQLTEEQSKEISDSFDAMSRSFDQMSKNFDDIFGNQKK